MHEGKTNRTESRNREAIIVGDKLLPENHTKT